MAQTGHTYGPTCAFGDQDATLTTTEHDGPPSVKAQFFYISALPIDDPLSPLPPIPTPTSKDAPPQPFSVRDNAALEEAWQALQLEIAAQEGLRPGSRGLHRMFSFPKFRSGLKSPETHSPTAESSAQGLFASIPDRKRSNASLRIQTTRETASIEGLTRMHSAKSHRKSSLRSNGSRHRSQSQTESQVMLGHEVDDKFSNKPVDAKELESTEMETGSTRRRKTSPFRRRNKQTNGSPDSLPEVDTDLLQLDGAAQSSQSHVESDISGRPFARAPSARQIPTIPAEDDLELDSSPEDVTSRKPSRLSKAFFRSDDKPKQTFVPVGISRLHLVELPDLSMKPIYWSPINDVSSVMRATWFYKDSMQPVPVDVANRLEIGYEDMKPYSDTYQDELNACTDNGAAAELKIVHKLWPDLRKSISRPSTALEDKPVDGEMLNEAIPGTPVTPLPDATENTAVDPRKAAKKRKPFESHSVIYINSREAQILKPSVLPSVSRNRKPLSSIRKGRELGVAVVRGFDRKVWNKLHPPPKMDLKATQAKMGAYMSQSGSAAIAGQRSSCPKCEEEESKPQVSDLVLVVHGIGQKLSERVDSYHFTHAINGLRREFNVEQAAESVKGSLRQDSRLMVLPVNWRLTVKFDEDRQVAENKYDLKDITPESLPAVRSLISDVMLDIPYYMSHHKSKMTTAVIREANRVYRLWCKNNPGFNEYGRVHLIAHSLGSVMAMEILSNQPTSVPANLNLTDSKPSEKMFEFNTTNLFCCGSPSGFFLLLNNANLVPRKGRNKAGMEGEDYGKGIAGETGQYGCLAVDNVYNICHRNDPIAYQQNACVDSAYATSLQPASIPGVAQSLFGKIGNSFRWAGASAYDAYGSVAPTRPTVQHMPSTVEMETHNFTQEEIAERRMFLLNENGQIDYFLSSGGGPLEIQYLNMLSAHSSYWYLRDFVRFLVVEIGRRPGRTNTLPALRAVKKREYKRGAID